jgi:flagellar motor protein MotB
MLLQTRKLSLRAARRGLHLALGLCAAGFVSGCVSAQKYDEMAEMARLYQDSTHDLEAYVAQLEAERDRWQASQTQEASAPAPTEPNEVDRELEDRMKELADIASRLGNAPGDVESVRVEGGYGFALKDSILFDSGSTAIKPEGREVLLRVAADIASKPYQTIWVRGHTDSDPVSRPETIQRFPNGNLELSAARAIEVGALLVKEGRLMSSKLNVAGLGPNRPVAENTSAEGKRRNRRVEIFVLEEDPEIQAKAENGG